ncbi:MAG: enoyl-CoA hydratase-related protein [Myxococcales bacterium]|nr:enoyl-CoA hydratase-related protein [Myxococcales bacterium]MDH3484001.1 enoyl-CoA hydratase-related protein [Myxococcales bacterium]
MSEDLIVAIADGVCEVQIARPQTKNSFLASTYADLRALLEQVDADDAVSVVLVYGQGGNFSSGNELGDFLENPPTSAQSIAIRFMHTLHRFTKPLIAAVDGFAVGIGTTMLLHCDIVYATESAKFLMPFVNLAVVPEAASTLLLPERAGLRLASELLYFAEAFDTEVAERAGLVSRIVPRDELLPFARKRAALLASKPVVAVRETKKLLRQDPTGAIAERIDQEAEIFCKMLQEPPAQAAIRRFLNKKK